MYIQYKLYKRKLIGIKMEYREKTNFKKEY